MEGRGEGGPRRERLFAIVHFDQGQFLECFHDTP